MPEDVNQSAGLPEGKVSLSEQLMAGLHASRDASRCGPGGGDGGAVDPRSGTRGSFSAKPLKTQQKRERAAASCPDLADLLDSMFFDWFQITLPNSEGKATCIAPDEEAAALRAAFEWTQTQGLHPLKIAGGHNGYRAALLFSARPEAVEPIFRVNSGSAGGVMPNLMLTGGNGACARLAPDLQRSFPGARLSRADASLDWSQQGLWDDLFKMAKTLAGGNAKLGGVRTIESDKGRTFYLGSCTSTVSVKVYEKDRERAAMGVIDAADVDPDLIRIEWTFRPQSKSKVGMAKLSPGELIRTSVWARDFMARAAAIMKVTERVERLNKHEVVREVAEKTLNRTVQYGVDQYAKSFMRLAAAQIVERDFDGMYDTAIIDPGQLKVQALRIFKEKIRHHDAAEAVIEEQKLNRSMDLDEWRDAFVHELLEHPERIEADVRRAQVKMAKAASFMGIEVQA